MVQQQEEKQIKVLSTGNILYEPQNNGPVPLSSYIVSRYSGKKECPKSQCQRNQCEQGQCEKDGDKNVSSALPRNQAVCACVKYGNQDLELLLPKNNSKSQGIELLDSLAPLSSSSNYPHISTTINANHDELETEITAKLFIPATLSHALALESVKSALTLLYKVMTQGNGVGITNFILSFGGLEFSEDDEDEEDDDEEEEEDGKEAVKKGNKKKWTDDEIYIIWKQTIDYASELQLVSADGDSDKAGNKKVPFVKQFGMSEFSTKRLSKLLANIQSPEKFVSKTKAADTNTENHASSTENETKPPISATIYKAAINHINAKDCCSLPPSLVTLSKKEGIKLLAHHDEAEVVSTEDAKKIVSVVQGCLSDGEEKEKKETKEADDDILQWVLKLTVFVIDRQVLLGDEYLVAVKTN